MSTIEEYMLPCLNKSLFGVECTGCGAQRALIALFKGEFQAAFDLYPAIFTLSLFAGFLMINLVVKFKHDYTIKIAFIIVNAAIIGVSYIAKMIQFFN